MQYVIFLTIFIVTNNFFPVLGQSGKLLECKERMPNWQRMTRKVMCKPRETLVKLNPDPGYTIVPDIIAIDRCSGRCGNKALSCMPVETTFEKLVVQRIQDSTFDSHCYELEVEKHTKCRCNCNLNESNCNSDQSFNAEQCACK